MEGAKNLVIIAHGDARIFFGVGEVDIINF